MASSTLLDQSGPTCCQPAPPSGGRSPQTPGWNGVVVLTPSQPVLVGQSAASGENMVHAAAGSAHAQGLPGPCVARTACANPQCPQPRRWPPPARHSPLPRQVTHTSG